VKITSPQDLFPENQSPLTSPCREEALYHFQNFNPNRYAQTRNFLNGQISRMSVHIKHGVIQNRELLKIIRDKFSFLESEKFIQELAWRDFWRSYAYHHPDQLWTDVEEYKTGFSPHDYLDDLPEDIAHGKTPTQVINYFIQELTQTGYLHNHARMYVASYVIHFRRVKWQAGAKFFLTHLLDGDIASNNFSWQWIASTFASKPYIFNLENVRKYCHQTHSLEPEQNQEIDGSYEEISAKLFPYL
jgi:deoxyribodipyrimidine photo-lyase